MKFKKHIKKVKKEEYSDEYLKWWLSRFAEAQKLFNRSSLYSTSLPPKNETVSSCLEKLNWFGVEHHINGNENNQNSNE